MVLEHFLTDTADHADYVLPATTQLEHWDVHTSLRPHLRDAQRAGDRAAWARRDPTRRSSARWPRAWVSPSRAFADDDEALARDRVRPTADGGVDFDQLARRGLGQADDRRGAVRRRRLSDAERQVPAVDAARASACPTTCPTTNRRSRAPSSRAAIPLAMISPPARNFLNSSFVNVNSLRAIEGEPVLEMHRPATPPRAASPRRQRVRVFNDRGEYRLQGASSARARGPASSTAWASGGASSAATAPTSTS